MSENTNRATGGKVRFSMTLQNYSELNTQTSHAQISCIDTVDYCKIDTGSILGSGRLNSAQF